jgi:hypothetical protein
MTDADWVAERAGFIARVCAGSVPAAPSRDSLRLLAEMPLEEFLALYQGAPGATFGTARARRALDAQTVISTGHVAIIAIDGNSQRLVVEACRPSLQPPKTYEAWLERFRKPFCVWQGRLRTEHGGLAAVAADTARKWVECRYSGAPFSLWNFDLDDPSAFYCAKLVWMAIYRASGGTVGLDGSTDPKRSFLQWCTPRSLMGSPELTKVFDPMSYGVSGSFREV